MYANLNSFPILFAAVKQYELIEFQINEAQAIVYGKSIQVVY